MFVELFYVQTFNPDMIWVLHYILNLKQIKIGISFADEKSVKTFRTADLDSLKANEWEIRQFMEHAQYYIYISNF